jgi:inner membrane protein
MLGRNHVIVGIGVYLGADHFLGTGWTRPDLVNCLATAALGSLVPDMDSPHSHLGRRLWPLSWTVSAIVGHRGFTHSCFACVLMVLGLAACSRFSPAWSAYFVAFGIGYASHILADWFTTEGVPLFWPNRKRFRCPLSFRTGGFGEFFFSLLAGAALGFWFYRFIL